MFCLALLNTVVWIREGIVASTWEAAARSTWSSFRDCITLYRTRLFWRSATKHQLMHALLLVWAIEHNILEFYSTSGYIFGAPPIYSPATTVVILASLVLYVSLVLEARLLVYSLPV